MNKYLRVFGFYLVILLIIVTAVTFFYPQRSETTVLKYSELLQKLENNEIAEIKVGETKVSGVLKEGNKNFESIVPRYTIDEKVTEYSIKNPDMKVVMDPPKDSWWISLIPSVFIVIMMIVFLVMMNQQSGGGGRVMSFGKSKAQLHMDNKKKVTFEHVAGADEEKEELAEVVDFLKSPERYNRMGARIPKGILLVGPPGTGKTLLARAVAGEASVPFYIISGSDFVEMFVGVGASRVRDLFDTAKKSSPCIIFIDEIDAVGRHRGAGLGGGHDEREQTLNQLLVEMDGFGINEGVIVIAATNRPDILDPALLRPGRFDRQITVGIPDVKGRYEILQVHRKDKPLDSTVDLNVIAKGTPGFTGADLENLMNEAALLAARKKHKIITMDELQEAIKRIIAGPEKRSKVIEESDRVITAYHESGHAIVMEYLQEGEDVHEISIVPRGMAAGYTIALPTDDTTHMSRGRLLAKITGLLGGRAAEKVALEDICTGASNDIERVTTIARKMVTEWGMSEHLGPMTFGHTNGDEVFLGRDFGRARNYSEEVAAVIDQEIRFIVEGAFDKAVDILTEKRDVLEKIAVKLLEVNTLTGDEFREIYYSQEKIEPQTDEQAALSAPEITEADNSDAKVEDVAAENDNAPS